MRSDDVHPEATFGERVKLHRTRLGMSRPTLGELVGRSAAWVKDIEDGTLGTPRPALLLPLARALRITNLAVLVSEMKVSISEMVRPGHEALPAIRSAMTCYRLRPPVEQDTISLGTLRSRVDSAWRTWHRSPMQRTETGRLLPDLIVDVQAAVAVLDGEDRREANRILATLYPLVQLWLAHLPSPEMYWLAVDRGMAAAQAADDPATLATAAWCATLPLRSVERGEESLAIVTEAVDLLRPHLEDADADLAAVYGMLHLSAAITHARMGSHGEAMAAWDRAHDVARRLGEGYAHPWMVFGRANVDLYSVAVEVDVGRPGDALARAERMDVSALPSVERRSRYYIDTARSLHRRGEDLGAVHMLLRAETESPEAMRYAPPVRGMVVDLVRGRSRLIREDVVGLADRLGIAA